METPIGILIPYQGDHAVIGNCCLRQGDVRDSDTRIYASNIGPLYSQHCIICESELVKGTSGVELFGRTALVQS